MNFTYNVTLRANNGAILNSTIASMNTSAVIVFQVLTGGSSTGNLICSSIQRVLLNESASGTVTVKDISSVAMATFYPGAEYSYYPTMRTDGKTRVLPSMTLVSEAIDIRDTTDRAIYIRGAGVSGTALRMNYQYSQDNSRWVNGTTSLANLTNGSVVVKMNDTANYIRLVMYNGNAVPEYPYVYMQAN